MVELISRQLLNVWEDRLLENGLEVVATKRLQAESFPTNPQNKIFGGKETFLQILLINHVERFSVRNLVAVFGNLGGKVPVVDDVLSSHEQKFVLLPHLMKTA